MAKVVPAILATEILDYRHKANMIRQLTDRFQLDIIDGEFVENRTIQPTDIAPPSGLKLDVHLMVKRPLEYISQVVKLRPYTIIVQYEADAGVAEAIDKIVANGLRAGVALNPDTPASVVEPLLPKLSHVLIMSYPAGFAGQKLQPRVFSKVAELREMKSELEIGLDGGVEESTLSKIAKARFDVVNVNSYLFGAQSPLTRYHELIGALA